MSSQANTLVSVNSIEHIAVRADIPFPVVMQRLEAKTGMFDLADVQRRLAAGGAPREVIDAIAAMAGPSGFMRFLTADHGAILRLHGHSAEAVRILVGHPLIAVRMTARAIGSALYAPLSLLIVSDGAGTRVEYDRPSTVFAQFHDVDIDRTARELDEKLDALIQSITAAR
jgi:hypothetical protein